MKTIVPFVLAFLVMAIGATAMSLPMIISGTVQDEGELSGFNVVLTNTRTSGQLTAITDQNGYFQFEPQNMPFSVRDGDIFEVEVLERKIVIDDFNYANYAPYFIEFDFSDERPLCVDCPEPIVCPEPTCPEPIVCDKCVVCPDPIICPEPCPEPEENFDWAWSLVIGLLAGAGGSAYALRNRMFTTIRTGYKRYVTDYGIEKILHKHPGIRGYHNPETSHRNSKIRHPKGQIIIKYDKDEDGDWKFTRD